MSEHDIKVRKETNTLPHLFYYKRFNIMSAIVSSDRLSGAGKRKIILTLHLLVVAVSVILIVWMMKETLDNISFECSENFMRFQLWVCVLFMVDIAVDWYTSAKKWNYLLGHIFFMLISIPWLNIINIFHIQLSPLPAYIIRFLPMIRAGYVLILISEALSSNRVLSLATVYAVWIVVSLCFGALIFFVEEHYINPLVDTYWSSLWWATLSLTTAGCDIHPYTDIGKVIGVFLSGEGLMIFPIFTVRITRIISTRARRKPVL